MPLLTSSLPFWAAALCFASVLQPAARAAEKAPELAPEAVAVVERVAAFYQAATTFSVTANSQVLRGSGVSLQPRKSYAVTLQKPDKLITELKVGEATVRIVVDGKTLSALNLPANEYRQVAAPASLAPVLQQISPGLDLLVAADPKAKILEGVTKLSLVGEEKLDEIDCVRLRFDQPDATIDMLVQKGDQPLMRRFILKTADNSTLIQFDLTDWKIDPKLEPEAFVFTPPADAKKMEVAAPAGGAPRVP